MKSLVDADLSPMVAGVTVRCLVRADGSLPETGDEPDILAYCAKAY